MYYLYGLKPGKPAKLVATFDSEQQLRAYVGWATLSRQGETYKFEQGSALAGYQGWTEAQQPQTEDDPQGDDVMHNPSPTML